MTIHNARAVASWLASVEIWVIALAAAAGTLSSVALPWMLVVAATFWAVRRIAFSRASVPTAADLPICLLLATLPVSLWMSVSPMATHPQVLRLLLGVALYYTLVNWITDHGRLRIAIIGLVLAGIVLALSAPFTVTWSMSKIPIIPPAIFTRFAPRISDVINPNVMAGTLVLVLPIVLAMLVFAWRPLAWSVRISAGLVALLVGSVLLLTQSRGALLALGAALAVLVVLRLSRYIKPSAVGVTLIVLGLWFARGSIVEQLTVGGSAGQSLASRREIWSRALYIIADFPWTGVGMGTFQVFTQGYYPLFLSPEGQPHAHNLFLQIAVDLGLPGLIAWLSIFMLVLAGGWQVYKAGRTRDDAVLRGLGAGFLSSQAALMTHGMTDAVTWGMVRTAIVVWVIWGITMAALRICEAASMGP